MHKLYTRVCIFALTLAMGACSSMSVPLVGPGSVDGPTAQPHEVEHEQVGQDAAQTADSSPASNAVPAFGPSKVVPTPRLNSGTQALFDRALALAQEGKLDAAQVLFIEITEDQPELAGPWVNLAKIHLAKGNTGDASGALDMAIAANPYNCDALTQMGVLARREGRFAEAEQLYRACIEAQPNYANAYLNLGILYELYQGKLNQALAAYNDFQIALPKPDQQVAGWVIDLERRVASIAKR